MKDVLSDVLSSLHLRSAVYFKEKFCSPWGMDVAEGKFAQFHIVSRGQCILYTDSIRTPTTLYQGDIILFPTGEAHQIKDLEEASCRPGGEIFQDIKDGIPPFSGENVTTSLICGHYELDLELSHPLFKELPSCVIIRGDTYKRSELIGNMIEMISMEIEEKKEGYELLTLKLAEVLLITLVRHYFQKEETEVNFVKDTLIYQSIGLMHADLSVNWKIEQLAREVGISRTLFIERFKKAVGLPPNKYIHEWKMAKAKQLLRVTDQPLSEVGASIGYHSEASFNRAFKQEFQLTPGKFRKSRLST